MALGGFALGKWKSSHLEVLTEEERIDQGEVTKILGVSRRTTDDVFTFIYDDERLRKLVQTPRHLVAISHFSTIQWDISPHSN